MCRKLGAASKPHEKPPRPLREVGYVGLLQAACEAVGSVGFVSAGY